MVCDSREGICFRLGRRLGIFGGNHRLGPLSQVLVNGGFGNVWRLNNRPRHVVERNGAVRGPRRGGRVKE